MSFYIIEFTLVIFVGDFEASTTFRLPSMQRVQLP